VKKFNPKNYVSKNIFGLQYVSGVLVQLTLDGIQIDVQRKNIRSLRIYVKPPLGAVHMSAPLFMPSKAIEAFAQSKIDWIKNQIKICESLPQSATRLYASGETIYVWGKPYTLEFVPSNRNKFELTGGKGILCMKQTSSSLQREKFIHEQFRNLLEIEIERLLPKWEKITGFHCSEWRTKCMKTRWGTCNTQNNRIWFNILLAQKDIKCLEYIILHELAHTKVRNHGKDFKAIMNTYMPNWKEVQKTLNEQK
jgi:predicted metal-dependent hydrolase